MKKCIAVLTALMILGVASCAFAADKFTIGICQLVQHPALDAATQGFRDVLAEEFGDAVVFDEQNAAGDSTTCVTICNNFVAEGYDLLLANATPALQAAAAATDKIPVLGTSITDYATALGLKEFNGTVGGNISGTADLAPLEPQARMFAEVLPNAKKIGILYCSAEPNSIYQADRVKAELEKMGLQVSLYTFADTNDVSAVTQTACDENDALYIPTDNTAASCAEAVANVAMPAKKPIIAGEEGIAKGCGIATLSISYYELGRTTGHMAVKILKGEAKVGEMPIEYYQNPIKEYVKDRCEELGIVPPESYEAI